MRKRADDVEARLAAIVEYTDDAIVSTSMDDTITSWNRAAERMFGYSAAEAIGQPIALIVPTDLASEEHEALERMRAGQAIDPRDTVRRRKDGTLLGVSLTVSALRDRRGREALTPSATRPAA